jgi:hypothetical protein
MNLDLSAAPEIALLARASAATPPFRISGGGVAEVTAGRLAGLVRCAAADPALWWRHTRFDPAQPVALRLDSAAGCEIWLVTTPPGYRGAGHEHGAGCEALTVVAGELTERAIGEHGGFDRMLRPNRIRVRGHGNLYETINPGSCYAVSLCAFAARALAVRHDPPERIMASGQSRPTV